MRTTPGRNLILEIEGRLRRPKRLRIHRNSDGLSGDITKSNDASDDGIPEGDDDGNANSEDDDVSEPKVTEDDGDDDDDDVSEGNNEDPE